MSSDHNGHSIPIPHPAVTDTGAAQDVPDITLIAVLDDADRVLMLRRYRNALDRTVCELPGGYLPPGGDPEQCAARDVQKLTGRRPRELTRLLAFQPRLGPIGRRSIVFLARTASPLPPVVAPAAADVVPDWIPLHELQDRIASGDVVGADSVSAVLAVLLARAAGRI